ncbi:class I adenylate-forming enzyme family protein [Roseomonas sp. CECT 9278]|uniref:class I adenylate-forming enzyme family protein n=1 Tax=Roseomonas sp. CECT 9278 TaxID=2845823 RepID=UPI001E360706|nr:class I adenylate-forming enzyme family protein [Roseomonas sp. CECT 9278]
MPPDLPMMARVEAIARATPDRAAFIRADGPVGYAQVTREVRALAEQFLRAGIAPGDAVGITIADDWTHILCSLALIRLGCRQVGLPRRDPVPLREDLARRVGVVAIIADDAADALGGATLVRPDREAAAAAADAPGSLPPIGFGELVMATSGTTGRPKLMVAREPMLLDQAERIAGFGGIFLHRPSFDGNHSKRLSYRSLVTGGTEVLAQDLPPRDLAALVARHGVTRVHLAPRDLATLPDALGDAAWPAGTSIVTTGTRVPQTVRRDVQRRLGCALHVVYGTTEAGIVSIAGPHDHDDHPDSVGRILPGVAAEALDDAGRPLPEDADGLLRFRTPAQVDGYLDDPEADATYFRDGWFHPGDVGRRLPGDVLLVAGRADDRMTLGVIKIFPAEIEAVAEGFPGLVECAVFPLPSAAFGEIPVLAAVVREGFDAAALLAHCRARLGMRAPRRIVVVPALPRNAQGKVLRRELARVAGGP